MVIGISAPEASQSWQKSVQAGQSKPAEINRTIQAFFFQIDDFILQMGREESIMRQWLDVCVTEGELLVAQQKLHKRPLLVAQMLEEWLNHYRSIA